MLELTDILLILIGLTSSFLGSAVAGGGLISFPALLFLGMPPQLALGITRASATGTSLGSFLQMLRNNNLGVTWGEIFIRTLIAVPAISLGTFVVVSIDSGILSIIMAIVLITLLPLIYASKDLGIKSKRAKGFSLIKAHIIYFFANVWAGFFSPGAGFLLTYTNIKFYGFTILEGKAASRVPVILANTVSIYFFVESGFFDFHAAAFIFVGAVIGSLLGMGLAIRKGNTWIKPLMGVVIIATIIKLLFF